MKTLIITLLVMSVLWQGCYSYSSIEKIQNTKLSELDNEDIEVTLNNGKTIKSEALLHKMVNVPTHFVFGIGRNLTNNKPFKGKIDFSNITKINESGNNNMQYVLNDGSIVQFNKNNFATVLPEDGEVYWVIGETEIASTNRIFVDKIPLDNIKDIEIRSFNTIKTVGLVLGGAIILGTIIVFAEGGPMADFNLFGGKSF